MANTSAKELSLTGFFLGLPLCLAEVSAGASAGEGEGAGTEAEAGAGAGAGAGARRSLSIFSLFRFFSVSRSCFSFLNLPS